jgi:tetratricopeptide (TPR) repeat protein
MRGWARVLMLIQPSISLSSIKLVVPKGPLFLGMAIVLLILGTHGSQSETLDDQAVESKALQGIQYVYNLQFELADQEFNAIVRERPYDPAGYAFLAMVDWWRILIDMDNTQYDERFFRRLDNVIDLCDSLLGVNENDVHALFFKGGAIGFKGRLKFHRDDWIAAANAGRKALPIVHAATSADPKNYDILLGSGIYNYYAEVIPNEYPLAKPLLLFIPPGNKKKGIEQLKIAAVKGRYASVEASYFLMQIYYYYEKDYPSALQLAEELHARFPNNMLFHKYLGRAFVSLGNWSKVEKVFSEIALRAQDKQRGYGPSTDREAEYYLGMCDMLAHRFDSALMRFYRCDELSRALDAKEVSGFMVMANLKVGMIYDLQVKRELAVNQYRKVLAMHEYLDSHDQAERFIRSPYVQ